MSPESKIKITVPSYNRREADVEISIEHAVEMTCEPKGCDGAIESCDQLSTNLAGFVGQLTELLVSKGIINAMDLASLLNVRGIEITEEKPTDL